MRTTSNFAQNLLSMQSELHRFALKLTADAEDAIIQQLLDGTIHDADQAQLLINRFSEDIDLLLDLHEVAGRDESFDKERTRNAINTFKSKTSKNTQ